MGSLALQSSELLAVVHKSPCSGSDTCHWCGASTERIWPHDEPVYLPFSKGRSRAKCPGSSYICQGCWLYRRRRVTYNFFDSGFKDGQCLLDHSWLLTNEGIWILRREDYPLLWEFLLSPSLRFSLSLLSNDALKNEIHLTTLNDYPEIKADTQLSFNLDNTVLGYSIYELEHAISKSPNGSQPGVHALLRILGTPPTQKEVVKRDKGRPVTEDGKVTQKVVTVSGQPLACKAK